MFSKIKNYLGKNSPSGQSASTRARVENDRFSDDGNATTINRQKTGETDTKNELARIPKMKVEGIRHDNLQEILMQMARMTAAGEIASGVAHEINNPLQVILGRVQIARMGKLTPENLDIIEAQAKRIAAIVRGFQVLARSDTQFDKESVNIKNIINDLIKLIQGQFYKRNIQIETEIATDLPVLWGDISHFQQLLLNFILSAKKRIENNGTIRLSANTNNKKALTLEIYDSGSPLTEETRRDISESFTGTTIQPVKDGCLTLAISAQMVRSIGGKVEIQPCPSVGNMVTITFPLPENKVVVDDSKAKQHSNASMA